MTSEVGARVDVDGDDTVPDSALKGQATGECGDGFNRLEIGELAWQVGDEAWLCDSGPSTDATP